VTELEISGAWLVDPATGREGPGDVIVRDGILETLTWLDGADSDGIDDRGIVVAPGFVDLHAHLREPGNEDAETIASGLAAAAHGGFTTVCAMPNTTPPVDDPSVVTRVADAVTRSGSAVRLLALGCVSAGRAGETLAPLGELADAGVVGFSDDGAPVQSAPLLRNALAYAGALGLPVVDHAEDSSLTVGAEANDGLVSTVLGLRGWPAAAEEAAVARDLAILADVVRDVPAARLHLTHLSTAGALDLVRRARASGLPVMCDVTPHHLALSDEWLAGARRYAWQANGRGPWADDAIVDRPFDPSLRVNPPLRTPADAPHTAVDKEVEFGLAANGIAGLETALGLLLEAVDARHLTLARAIQALTIGPATVLGDRLGRQVGLVEGVAADLVVFDRGERWTVSDEALATKGRNTPLLGRDLPGRVMATIAGGRVAYLAPDST
jgi:dihydroorotase